MAPRPVGSGWRQRLEIAFFVTPALALMAVFVVWPVVSAVRMSFYRWKGFGPMDDFIGIDNYRYVLTDEVFTGAVTHNFIIVFASILIQLPLGPGRRAAARPARSAAGGCCARSCSCRTCWPR